MKIETEILRIPQVLHFGFHLRWCNADNFPPTECAYLQALFLRFL